MCACACRRVGRGQGEAQNMAPAVRPQHVLSSVPGGTQGQEGHRLLSNFLQAFFFFLLFQPQSNEKPSELGKKPGPGQGVKRNLQPAASTGQHVQVGMRSKRRGSSQDAGASDADALGTHSGSPGNYKDRRSPSVRLHNQPTIAGEGEDSLGDLLAHWAGSSRDDALGNSLKG